MKKVLTTILAISLTGSILGQQQTPTERTLRGRTLVYGQDVHLPHPIQIKSNDNRTLEEILDATLTGTGIQYRITDSHILLFAPEKTTRTHTLYGYVTDAISRETLIGATLYIPQSSYGATTNVYGYFSITLPEGELSLEASYVGYGKQTIPIRLTRDTLLNISLMANSTLDEVIIESDRPETGATSSRSGAITVPVQQIIRTPAILGEADVIKALHLQPGVQSGMSGQVSMCVRGGETDQNLFLLDGMMLYNVDHVLGFESAFMPDAVKHVDFYRGSFSSRYGGRLSSVTDVRTKDGDMQHYHGNISIGLLSSHLSVEGPIVPERTSFIVSARRSYTDLLFKMMEDVIDIQKLYFYDINAKVNHIISDSDRIYLSFYQGRDALGIADKYGGSHRYEYSSETLNDVRWGNTLFQFRWNHLFSPSLFANLTIGYNQFRLNEESKNEVREHDEVGLYSIQSARARFRSGVDDLSAQLDLDYHPQPMHHIRVGAHYTMHQFHPEVQQSRLLYYERDQSNETENYSSGENAILAHESALYAEDDMTLGNSWQLNAGLRTVLFTIDGKSFPNIEPRISLCRLLPGGLRAKASYTIMHQYVHKLSSTQIASPNDLWVPVTSDMHPMSGHQWTMGLACNRWKGWETGIDIYWKKMNHVIDYIDGSGFLNNNNDWQNKISSGRGRAYGLELFASRNIGKTTGMVNYTWAKSDRWYPDAMVNAGRKFPFRYDRRHVVHILIQHQLTRRIDINASWNYASGAMTTIAKQQTEYIEPTVAVTYVSSEGTLPGLKLPLEPEPEPKVTTQSFYSDYFSGRNNYRLESTHQLDLSVNFHRQKRHGERIWNVSLMNVYNRQNQDWLYSVIKTYEEPDPDKPYVSVQHKKRVLKQATIIPLLPSVSYTYKF